MKLILFLRKKWNVFPVTMKAGICFSAAMFMQKGLQSLSTPIFTRMMSPVEYEGYTVYYAWSSIITIIATLCLSSGVLNNQLIKGEESRDKIVSSMQGLASIWAIGFLSICSLLFGFGFRFNEMPLHLWILMLISFVFSSSLELWTVSKRFYYEYQSPCIVMIIVALLTFFVPFAFVLFSTDKENARILGTILVNLVIGIIFWIYNYQKGRVLYSEKIWKTALAFNLPLLPHFLSLSILNQIDKIMIEKYCVPGQAAIYSVAHTVSAIIQLLMTAINYSLVPWTYQKLKNREYENIAKKSNIILLTVGVVLAILMLFAPEVMTIMAPKEYREAIYIIPSMTAGIYFNYLYQLYSRIELYHERTKPMMVGTVSCAALNIVLNYILVNKYGYMAAAYTTLFCYFCLCLMHAVLARKIVFEFQYDTTPFNSRGIVMISVGVLVVTLLMPMLYKVDIVRGGIIALIIAACILNRKKLIILTKYITNK